MVSFGFIPAGGTWRAIQVCNHGGGMSRNTPGQQNCKETVQELSLLDSPFGEREKLWPNLRVFWVNKVLVGE